MRTDTETIQEKSQFEQLIQSLLNDSYGCCNNFLLPKTMAGLRANMTNLNTSGNLKHAGIGNKMVFHEDKMIRSDKVNWIDGHSTNPYERIYLSKVGRFITYLNETCFTSINSTLTD